MSLFTGLYYAHHRVRGFLDVLDAGRTTFPEILRAAGWVGGAFTENGFLIGGAGFRRGFGVYVENRSADLHRSTGQGPEVFRAGLDWLARHADEPFLLMLQTYQAHWPYTPADPYRRLFPASGAAPTNLELARLRYEQEIRHTADHGEEFGEHGQSRHGHHSHDEAIGVPLVLRLPEDLPAGRRIDFPVSLVDVGPTILDGGSLVPWVCDPDRPPRDVAVFVQAPATLTSRDSTPSSRASDRPPSPLAPNRRSIPSWRASSVPSATSSLDAPASFQYFTPP